MLFNKQTSQPHGFDTMNHQQSPAYTLSPKLELYSAVVTASLSDKFYEKGGERINRIVELIWQNDPEFVAKLAVYTREKMYLRSVPLVLTAELAKYSNGNALVKKLTERVVQRADEISELLACYQLSNQRKGIKKLNKLSKQLQKGLSGAFNKFDEYQFAKYNRDGIVKLRDALFLVHPKPKSDEQQALFNKIAADTLNTPYTWETRLSAIGQAKYTSEKEREAAFRNAWEELIDSGKMGYMATLRNLRNILVAGVSPKHIARVAGQLSDAKQVAASKQLPFRFLSAYRELQQVNTGSTGILLEALEQAVLQSATNIRGFGSETKVVIACDVSGSMQRAVSPKSTVQNFDIGLVLGMLLQSQCSNVITGMFGDRWKTIAMPRTQVLRNVMEFHRREGEVGYSTNGYLVIQDLLDRKVIVDKIFMFTDCQLWNTGGSHIAQVWMQYKQFAPDCRLYLFDLAGYGTTPLRTEGRNDVFLVAGWSDKIFDVLTAIEDGSNAVQMIEAVEL